LNEEKQEEIALFRHGILFPVLRDGLRRGALTEYLREVAAQKHDIPHSEKTEISVSTLKRWRRKYLEEGFDGLKPKFRSDRDQPRAIDPEVLDRACQLRKENPDRSARQIIEMLQLSEEIAEGEVKRSTLSRHLRKRGLSRKMLKQEEEDGAKLPYRRFEAEAPNHLWQSDVKYGPRLPHPEDEQRNIQTYLIGFLDDFSRRIIHAEFYYHQDLVSLTDCCKKALLKGGVPQAIYVDHGKIYLSARFEAAVAQLGGKVITGKTYHPEGRGKIERLWREVNSSFASELQLLDGVTSISQLNDYMAAWVGQHHNQKVHSETDMMPEKRFARYLLSPQTVTRQQVDEAFLWRDERQVQKTATISFEGNRYEVEGALVGKKIVIHYDPTDLQTLRVYYRGEYYGEAQPVDLHREHHSTVAPRAQEQVRPSTGLNYLQLLKKEQRQKQRAQLDGLQFRDLPREED